MLANPPWVKTYSAVFQAFIRNLYRRGKLRSHIRVSPVEVETFGEYLLKKSQSNIVLIEHGRDYRGKTIIFAGYVDENRRVHLLKELYTQYQQEHFWYNYLYNFGLFLSALRAIQDAIFRRIAPCFLGAWNLRYLIKSLNLPKNLFPQSLRPIESLAH
jgi:hypothetical protein